MYGERRWKVLVLVAGLLLAQATDLAGPTRRIDSDVAPGEEQDLGTIDEVPGDFVTFPEEVASQHNFYVRSYRTPQLFPSRYPFLRAPRFTYNRFPQQPNRPRFGDAPFGFSAPSPESDFTPMGGGFWRTRTPRVVFPYTGSESNGIQQFQSNSHQAGTGNAVSPPAAVVNSYSGNDNVVFRDQNFGLNELAAVQDVRNDFNLQDIATANGNDEAQFKERETPEHRKRIHANYDNSTSPGARRPKTLQHLLNDKQRSQPPFLRPSPPLDAPPGDFLAKNGEQCNQGGTCEFFLYCWMSGGLLDGSCGGLLKGCCHRHSKAGALGVQDSNALDGGPVSALANPWELAGPVANDDICNKFTKRKTGPRAAVVRNSANRDNGDALSAAG